MFIQFPSKLTEEELALQQKYQKLKKKVGNFFENFNFNCNLILFFLIINK